MLLKLVIMCRGAQAKRSDYMCYANSKLLLMMFCGELQRRLRSAGSTIDCMSAHPGISSTDIFRKQDKSKPSANVLDLLGNNVLARIQPPERGCHSMLYAATEPALTGEWPKCTTAWHCASSRDSGVTGSDKLKLQILTVDAVCQHLSQQMSTI